MVDFHNEDLIQYEISFIDANDATVKHQTTDCNGSDNTIKTNRMCAVDMAAIQTLTGLLQGELIQVTVRAENINGWSSYSQLNIKGVIMQ